MGAKKRTWLLCESSKHSEPLSHLASLSFAASILITLRKVRGNLKVVLICTFPMAKDAEYLKKKKKSLSHLCFVFLEHV